MLDERPRNATISPSFMSPSMTIAPPTTRSRIICRFAMMVVAGMDVRATNSAFPPIRATCSDNDKNPVVDDSS